MAERRSRRTEQIRKATPPRRLRRVAWAATARARTRGYLLLLILVLGACGRDGETALARGDRLWADSQFDAALSEYRLAARGRDELALLRVAHAYVQLGQIDRARQSYDQVLERHPEYADQAVYDYVRLARRAQVRNDRHGLAASVEAARALRPDLGLDEFALPLARYYLRARDHERALDYFERALAVAPPDSAPALIYEIGVLHEARGNCPEAMGYFQAYLNRPRRGPRTDEARWHIGSCSFRLARDLQDGGAPAEALRHLETVIRFGQPENLLDQAFFQRAEILFALGHSDEALESYWRFLELTPTRSGALVERAQRRIDEIRFGRTAQDGWGGVERDTVIRW